MYLHERDAFDTQISLLKQQQIVHGIAHCFTGDTTQLKAYLDFGLYIGITGWLCDDRRVTAATSHYIICRSTGLSWKLMHLICCPRNSGKQT